MAVGTLSKMILLYTAKVILLTGLLFIQNMESFTRFTGDKAAQYQHVLAQATQICTHEDNLIAVMANLSALLNQQFGWLWTGFYLVDATTQTLVLGPFQGPLACTRIPFGKGVCGTAWAEARSVVVPDVHAFPGHIACSALSKSEVVIPCLGRDGEVKAVLDIDSDVLNGFTEEDAASLEQICALLKEKF